jgi:hypothetical protein
MGGFWLDLTHNTPQHILWCAPFPDKIQNRLLTAENPSRSLTINDLELAALILGSAMAANHQNHTVHPHICLALDNAAAVSWITKGPQHPKKHRHTYVTNTIADCCSRLFHLSGAALLSYMNMTFPVQPCWQIVHPTNETLSALSFALSKTLQPLASTAPDVALPIPHGTCGKPSAPSSALIHICNLSQTQYPFCKYLHTDTALDKWLPVGLKSALVQWKAPLVPWARH